MVQLEVRFTDGTSNAACGSVDWIEEAIERAALAGKEISSWSIATYVPTGVN